jgi:hypothetical protein
MDNEELHDIHFSPFACCSGDQIKKSVMDWACGTLGAVARTIGGFGGEI